MILSPTQKATPKHHLRSLHRHALNRKSNARTAQNHRLLLPRYHYSTQKKNTETRLEISSPIPFSAIQKQHRPTPAATLLPPSSNNLQPKSCQKHHPLITPSKKNTAENLRETSSSHPHFAHPRGPRSEICERDHPLMPISLIQED
jgi:hypothetical protein